ncbi:MAG: hypothetical protein VYC72_03140 [Verrucomicrobiota bacterium]|nr:hypothetical protein [Verrucomicrobiota bacterium]MED5258807.1 hypothetical protein [Verrucomicrobiota bacterium]
MSTPTKTSPVGAAHKQAGEGVDEASENLVDSSSWGTCPRTELINKPKIEAKMGGNCL